MHRVGHIIIFCQLREETKEMIYDRKTQPIKSSIKLELQDKHCQPTSTLLVRKSSKYEAQLSKENEDQKLK